eukprot:gene7670-biopygen7748
MNRLLRGLRLLCCEFEEQETKQNLKYAANRGSRRYSAKESLRRKERDRDSWVRDVCAEKAVNFQVMAGEMTTSKGAGEVRINLWNHATGKLDVLSVEARYVPDSPFNLLSAVYFEDKFDLYGQLLHRELISTSGSSCYNLVRDGRKFILPESFAAEAQSQHSLGRADGPALADAGVDESDSEITREQGLPGKTTCMFSFELKDRYHTSGIHPAYQKYALLALRGNLMQCSALPFLWNDSPWIFAKVTRGLVESVRTL